MANHVSIQKYRNSLKEFENHIKPHFNDRFSLNGHMPRYNPMGWISSDVPDESRGVDSDLIVIFQDKTKPVGEKPTHIGKRKVYNSIAFSFNQNDEDPTFMDVIFSIKTDGEITSSEAFSESVFRDLIRQINRSFRNDGVPESREDLLSALSIFLDNEEKGIQAYDPDKSLQELLGEDGELIDSLYEKIEAASEKSREDREKLEKISSDINMAQHSSEDAKQIRELEKKIALLKSKMKKDYQKQIKEAGSEEIEASISSAKEEAYEYMDEMRKASARLKRKTLPGSLMRDHLDSWLRKHTIRTIR